MFVTHLYQFCIFGIIVFLLGKRLLGGEPFREFLPQFRLGFWVEAQFTTLSHDFFPSLASGLTCRKITFVVINYLVYVLIIWESVIDLFLLNLHHGTLNFRFWRYRHGLHNVFIVLEISVKGVHPLGWSIQGLFRAFIWSHELGNDLLGLLLRHGGVIFPGSTIVLNKM